ncbi:deoxyguanosinetriphosphate triphosphohydrolase-like protein [Streptomyces sulfonofaciens]|uniref:Deoxyguanosinetriphosphate triphosphohydrolase-like protein n=1 Tax=Streptomyces sulfonofaciens TaxID=68272 RepID=A0A919L7R2_9ACTN|nr:deoxyguanosinetriphosphate triphosphohydrolase [Streptomyces sulfonofaciens]GHH87057.1 deoxyguanosinetriphosphate triphosphohydrolase-like protein [Streptomyces sulfonofaciens]
MPPAPFPGAARYDAAALERWAAEPDKRPGRTAFQRDRARVLHSAALRRLAGKTQVVTPGTYSQAWDPSPRTRLTHSLECAQVGRELGAALGCDPDLVETACLSHDLGHPPFGHNGEQALNEVAKDCGGFEGNAQSLRLLTRLEPKRFVRAGTVTRAGAAGGPSADPPQQTPGNPPGPSEELVSVGLNLTRAALDAATKYPWPLGGHPTDPDSRKFGVYEDDRPVFDWFRRGAPPYRICFEAQVMDWSDDVAYSVHDLEDGLHAGHVDPNALCAEPERRAILDVAIGRYVPADTGPEELAEALDRLLDQEWWPHGYDGSSVAQARLKDATSQLIGRFCLAAESATHARWGPRPGGGRAGSGAGGLSRYEAQLVVPRATRNECAVLKAVADLYVMQRAEQERLRADQRVIVAELAAALAARAPEGLDPQFRALFDTAADDRARKRVIVDQIASLTDATARALHRRFTRRAA